MAFLTQYSGTVPVIKFNIDQSVMTIGQDIDMDICVPEDGISDNHAAIEAIQNKESYRFVIKSREDEPQININGESVSIAELQDGDWIIIGDVEFQFTDDGIYDIKQVKMPTVKEVVKATKPQLVKTEVKNPAPLELVQEVQIDSKAMSSETAHEDNRFSRRLHLF